MASAQPVDEARAAYEQGVAYLAESRFHDAAVALERSNRLRPLPVVTWNLAIAYRGLGRAVAAVEAFERYLIAPEPTAPPERLAAIRDELVELRRRVVRVTLTVTPPEATLVIDGRPQGVLSAGHALSLDPGPHVFEWSATDHRPLRREIAGAAGSSEVFNERLEPVQDGRLIVEPLPLTASVTLDGRPLGASRQELTLPPGEHWVELSAPGYVATRRAVRVGATGVVRLSLSLERVRLPGWVLPVSVVGSALVVAGVGTLVYFVARPEVPAARVGTWDNVQEPVR